MNKAAPKLMKYKIIKAILSNPRLILQYALAWDLDIDQAIDELTKKLRNLEEEIGSERIS